MPEPVKDWLVYFNKLVRIHFVGFFLLNLFKAVAKSNPLIGARGGGAGRGRSSQLFGSQIINLNVGFIKSIFQKM